MFNDTVTLFVNYKTKTENKWYPYLLENTHLETSKADLMQKYGAETADSAVLHIRDASNYKKPKEWSKSPQENLPDFLTLKPNDFFVEGDYSSLGVVDDDTYTDRNNEGFYAYMNRTYDHVYLMTSVNEYTHTIKHFEVIGK